MGKGKKDSTTEASEHRPLPIASLKNPDAFGPPPKRVNGTAIPNYTTPTPVEGGEGLNIDAVGETYDDSQEFASPKEPKETSVGRKVPPPIPYRAKSAGNLTINTPKRTLPGDRVVEDFKPKPKPSLPPRLPPRQISVSPQSPSSPPPTYSATVPPNAAVNKSYLNQGALRRLGSAGITVPELGIEAGSRASNLRQADDGNPKTRASLGAAKESDKSNSQLPKYSDFSPIQKASGPDSPSQGTTLAQKKGALKTAAAFRKDPSSVSLADAKTTASTMNNFRERHGEQVASGMKSANALNQKYDISSKLAGQDPTRHDSGGTSSTAGTGSVAATPSSMRSGWTSGKMLDQQYVRSYKFDGDASSPTAIKDNAQLASAASNTASDSEIKVKRPPPPPPPKKNFISSATSSPPPIPVKSKPKAY